MVFITAEIGINHNGDVDIAKQLIDVASNAGCDAVKFQKRTPELCVPRNQWDIERDTPWGVMKYIDYRHKVEFDESEYQEISEHCKLRNIDSNHGYNVYLEYNQKFNVKTKRI